MLPTFQGIVLSNIETFAIGGQKLPIGTKFYPEIGVVKLESRLIRHWQSTAVARIARAASTIGIPSFMCESMLGGPTTT